MNQIPTLESAEISAEIKIDLLFFVAQNKTLKRKMKTILAGTKPRYCKASIYKISSIKLPSNMGILASSLKKRHFATAAACRPFFTHEIILVSAMAIPKTIKTPMTILGKNKCDVEYLTVNRKGEFIFRPP
jgi:hypothetical protein